MGWSFNYRGAAILSCSAAFLFSAGSATAHYSVTYSGGESTYPSGPAYSYASTSEGYGGGTPGGTCSGEITATFTWQGQPSDVPPKVLVKETCVALASAGSLPFYVPAGSCSNGLGHPTVVKSEMFWAGPGFPLYHESKSSGLAADGAKIPRYKVVDSPGNSFTIKVSPIASAPIGFPATASVRYAAEAFPARLTLSGHKVIGGIKQAMIGQTITASLQFDGYVPNSQADSFAWSVSGAAPFEDYDPTKADDQYTPFVAPSGATRTVKVHFAEPDSAQFVCTANMASIGVTLDLSADLELLSPEFQNDSLLLGRFGLYKRQNGSLVEEYVAPRLFRFINGQLGGGATLDQWVKTPSAFVDGGDVGVFCFAQLAFADVNPSNPNDPSLGVWGLDGSFPYPIIGGPHPANRTQRSWRDSPGFDAADGYAFPTKGDYTGQFALYVMYLPPGQGRYVPLRKLEWKCIGAFDSSQSQTPPYWIVRNPNGELLTSEEFPAHPGWNKVINMW